MANGEREEKFWDRIIQRQKSEMDEIVSSFKEFFKNNQELTIDELRDFFNQQIKGATKPEVQKALADRLKAIEQIKGKEELSSEELKDALNNVSKRFQDDLNILSSTVTAGNQYIQDGFSKLTGVLRESFGPVFELFDSTVSILSGTYSTIVGMFNFIKAIPAIFRALKTTVSGMFRRDKQLTESQEQTGLLKNIWGYFKGERKRSLRQDTTQEGGGFLTLILGAIAAAAGAGLGAIIRKTFLPFEMMLKTVRGIWAFIKESRLMRLVTTGVSKIFNVFKFIGGMFGRVFSPIKKAGDLITTVFKSITGIFGKVFGVIGRAGRFLSQMPVISSFVSGFVKGFKKLFLPLQVIMSVIDFIQGFMGNEGTFVDKIKAGLMRVVHDFIELPVKLLGGIADWVLGLFNIEIQGGAGQAIMDTIMKMTKFAIDAIMSPFKTIKSGIMKVWNFFTGEDRDTGQSLFQKIINTVKGIPGKIADWISGLIPSWESIKSKVMDVVPSWAKDWFNFGDGKPDERGTKPQPQRTRPEETRVPRNEFDKSERSIEQQSRIVDTINRHEKIKIQLYKDIRNNLISLKQLYQEQNRNIATANSQSEENTGKDRATSMVQQPPDEIENFALLMFNKNWGLG